MLFSKPYHLDDSLLDNTQVRPDEQPLEYHVHRHAQSCSACGQTSVWSEVTLLTFNRTRKARIVRAAPILEYNIPLHVHHHEPVTVPTCGECASLAHFALRHLPTPALLPTNTNVKALWREQAAEKPKTQEKKPTTIEDLLA